jgi:hypothetical protein
VKRTITLFVVLLATAITCFGQWPSQLNSTSPNARWCDPSGTWYGGSDMTTPYHLAIEPTGIGRYAVRFQLAINYPAVGILGATDWTGQMTLAGPGQKYDLHAVAFFVLSPEQAAAMGGALDMDAVHSTIEFSDCNTIQHTITTYMGYIPWIEEKVPFVTNPDWNYLQLIGVQTIVEKYHRMPTACTNCPTGGTATSMLRPNGPELRGKRR